MGHSFVSLQGIPIQPTISPNGQNWEKRVRSSEKTAMAPFNYQIERVLYPRSDLYLKQRRLFIGIAPKVFCFRFLPSIHSCQRPRSKQTIPDGHLSMHTQLFTARLWHSIWIQRQSSLALVGWNPSSLIAKEHIESFLTFVRSQKSSWISMASRHRCFLF